MRKTVSRRHFLTGKPESPERSTTHMAAIASAVVSVIPGKREDVVTAFAALPHTEIRAADGHKIVLILEGRTRDEIGGRLAHIAMMDGVIAASMVFEHADYREETP